MQIQQVPGSVGPAPAPAPASRQTGDRFAAVLAAAGTDTAAPPASRPAADHASQVRSAIDRYIPRPRGLDATPTPPAAVWTGRPAPAGYDYEIPPIADMASAPVGTGKRGQPDVIPAGNTVPPGTPLSSIEEGAVVVMPNVADDPYATAAPQDQVFIALVAPVALRVPTPGQPQSLNDALASAFARYGGFFDNTGRVDAANHITKTQPWAWQVLPRPDDS